MSNSSTVFAHEAPRESFDGNFYPVFDVIPISIDVFPVYPAICLSNGF